MQQIGSKVPGMGQHDKENVHTYDEASGSIELLAPFFLGCELLKSYQMREGKNKNKPEITNEPPNVGRNPPRVPSYKQVLNDVDRVEIEWKYATQPKK